MSIIIKQTYCQNLRVENALTIAWGIARSPRSGILGSNLISD
jgi:hypothetical protein